MVKMRIYFLCSALLISMSLYSMDDDALSDSGSSSSSSCLPALSQEVPVCPKTPEYENEIPWVGGEMSVSRRREQFRLADERCARNQEKKAAHASALMVYEFRKQEHERVLEAARQKTEARAQRKAAKAQEKTEREEAQRARAAEIARLMKLVSARTKL